MRARPSLAVALIGVVALLAGCSFGGASSLPLPGGAAHGQTYTVTAIFSDVQDLTKQSAVRVNDVAVGDVTNITLGQSDLKAHVQMRINDSVHLPRNAVATLEQTTLLGEKFVALAPPANVPAVGTLVDGDTIDDRPGSGSTSQLPSVEEVFGLLSQVLNGGDLADLQTIDVEVTKALAGRETAVRGSLRQLNRFVSGLNSQKHQIVRALLQLNRFSAGLAQQNQTISTALDQLGPGLKVLADERAQFTSLLSDLSSLGVVATHVIHASGSQTVTALRDLQPILHRLAAAGSSLPRSLEILLTFPFPKDAAAAAPGDFTNFTASIDLAPVICAALVNFSPADLATLLAASSAVINELLDGATCPNVKGLSASSATSATSAGSGVGAALAGGVSR